MSWFRRKPTVKEPPSLSSHRRNSPASERLLKETKSATKPTLVVPKNNKK